MILSGSYAAMRTFIHQLETAPEFVIIDNVSLAEDDPTPGRWSSHSICRRTIAGRAARDRAPGDRSRNPPDGAGARRQAWALLALVVALAAVVVVRRGTAPSADVAHRPLQRRSAGRAPLPSFRSPISGSSACRPAARSRACDAQSLQVSTGGASPARPASAAPVRPATPAPVVPQGPPPPPPIPLKFIGVLDQRRGRRRSRSSATPRKRFLRKGRRYHRWPLSIAANRRGIRRSRVRGRPRRQTIRLSGQ
jgi:hypothetical protein